MLFSHSLDLEAAQVARLLLNSLLKNLNTRIEYFYSLLTLIILLIPHMMDESN